MAERAHGPQEGDRVEVTRSGRVVAVDGGRVLVELDNGAEVAVPADEVVILASSPA